MSISETARQKVASLAGEMAESGEYAGVAELELELRDRGYPEAREWLSDPHVREAVDQLCRSAKQTGRHP